jgi:hypothetical protein
MGEVHVRVRLSNAWAYVMGSEILIGQTTLEATDLLVDCKEQPVIGKHSEGPIFRL